MSDENKISTVTFLQMAKVVIIFREIFFHANDDNTEMYYNSYNLHKLIRNKSEYITCKKVYFATLNNVMLHLNNYYLTEIFVNKRLI